jgi:hypothetical protein
MLVRQMVATATTQDLNLLAPLQAIAPHWVIIFAAPQFWQGDQPRVAQIAAAFPNAVVMGCSSAGEIAVDQVVDDSLVVTAIHFEHGSQVRLAHTTIDDMSASEAAGGRLGAQLAGDDLRAIVVLSCGLDVNGSALIAGVVEAVGSGVAIGGGLAGDNGAFARTWILHGDEIDDRGVVAVGIYGGTLQCQQGSRGGWSSFGPLRRVTRAEANILFELDGIPALELYRNYLGEYANALPASGLLFPFEMVVQQQQGDGVIRTIIGIDEPRGALILAGDIDPQGYLRLMHATMDALVSGAEQAADRAMSAGDAAGGLALLVSCVGRKLVMGDMVEDELDAVHARIGRDFVPSGFYSYGEISPLFSTEACKLHNQSMTVTLLFEV